LAHGAGDRLFFSDEQFCFLPSPVDNPHWTSLGSGHAEAGLIQRAGAPGQKTASVIRKLVQNLVVYQFHDTSFRSRIRNTWAAEDGLTLKEDAGNLGAFLFCLRESNEPEAQTAYQTIEATARRIAPFFDRFVLEPRGGKVLLRWLEKGTDMVFSADQASDGMLRALALISLLSQPRNRLPSVLFLDEPELGLHPFAIQILVALLNQASKHSQIFVATQSPLLLDGFEPSQVVVVSRQGRESLLERKSEDDLAAWREDYTLGELWRKNLLGGGPLA
jgi:predicted ATPase